MSSLWRWRLGSNLRDRLGRGSGDDLGHGGGGPISSTLARLSTAQLRPTSNRGVGGLERFRADPGPEQRGRDTATPPRPSRGRVDQARCRDLVDRMHELASALARCGTPQLVIMNRCAVANGKRRLSCASSSVTSSGSSSERPWRSPTRTTFAGPSKTDKIRGACMKTL